MPEAGNVLIKMHRRKFKGVSFRREGRKEGGHPLQKDVTLQPPSPITREQECINRKRQERRSHLIVG